MLLIASYLYLFPFIVAAPACAQSQALTPGTDVRFQRPFILGVVAYNQKRYADAVAHLKNALAYYPAEANALTYLFYAAFELKDYPTAIQAGEPLRKHGGVNSATLYLLGKAYRASDQEDKARELFQVIAGRSNDPYLDAAEFALAETGLNYRPRGLKVYFSLGYEYDDNISPQPSTAGSAPSNIKDYRWAPILSLEYNKRLGERFFAGANLLGFGQFYRHEQARPFKYELRRMGAYAGVVGLGWDARFSYEYDKADLDDQDYWKADRFALSANNRLAKNYMLILRAASSHDDFVNELLDAKKTELHWANRLFLPGIKEGAYVELGYQAVDNDTDRDDSTAAYRSGAGRLAGFMPLPWAMFVDAGATYERRRFDMSDPTTRDDDITTYSLALIKQWDRNLSSRLSYRRLKNDSTVSDFDYYQHVYGLSVTYVF